MYSAFNRSVVNEDLDVLNKVGVSSEIDKKNICVNRTVSVLRTIKKSFSTGWMKQKPGTYVGFKRWKIGCGYLTSMSGLYYILLGFSETSAKSRQNSKYYVVQFEQANVINIKPFIDC